MPKRRLNTILKLAAPTHSKNENAMPISRKNENAVPKSSNTENTSVNLPILTYEDIIRYKFLIKGHTQMTCDSAYYLIERKLKGKDIYLPSNFIKITKEARKNPSPFEATLLSYDFFLNYKSHQVYNSI